MSLVARHLESEGFATLSLASALDIIEAGRPPRSVFIDYPLGHTGGKPFDPDDQLQILRGALDGFGSIERPGEIVRLDHRWSSDDAWRREAMSPAGGDVRQPRDTTPRYQTEADRRLAELGT